MASVIAPDMNEYCQWSAITKARNPNNPYTIDGIPDNVSTVILISLTIFEPFFEYSARYMAEKTPTGTAMTKVHNVINTVLIIAGIIDWFSEVNCHSKSSGFIFGIPLTSIYPIINIIAPIMITAERIIRINISIENG